MSRHRNVRTMNYDDDYEGYYDVYGRSQEEDSCISPTTEEQFLYNRDKLHSMSSFLSPDALQEENEDENDAEEGAQKSAPSEPQLSPVDEVRLYECIEKMQNVVGDSIPEATLRRAALEGEFNAEVALDRLLREADKPKPQREPRDRRRESDDEDATCDPPTSTASFAVWDSGGRRGAGCGEVATLPQHVQTVVPQFDVPLRLWRGNAWKSRTGTVPRGGKKMDPASASQFSFPSPQGPQRSSSSLGCELRLDDLLKLGEVGREPKRTGSLSKDTRDDGGVGCESDREVSPPKSGDGVAPDEKLRKASSVEDLLESLLQSKSPGRGLSGQDSADCVLGTGTDEPRELRLDGLLKSSGAGTDELGELRLDDLLKLGDAGRASDIGCEAARTGDASKGARVGVARDAASLSRDTFHRETPGSTKFPSLASPVVEDSLYAQGAHETALSEKLSKSPLKNEDSSKENSPPREKAQCVSSDMPDDLEALLGMVSGTKPSQLAKICDSSTFQKVGGNLLKATTPVADAVEDSLDALLGISTPSKQGGVQSGNSELDDFLMSLGSDSLRKDASVKPSDSVTPPLSILDVLSDTSKVEKSPVKPLKKPDRKESYQPASLNLGEILGLNKEPSSGLLGENGALNLDGILKNAGNSSDKEKFKGVNEVTGVDSSPSEPATAIPPTAVPAKEPSLFGKVLVFFPLHGRRREAAFDIESWLTKLDSTLQSEAGETKPTRFDFSTPSPDDIVLACQQKASNSSERKPAAPIEEEESAATRVPIPNKESLPPVNRALRQFFGVKPPDPDGDGDQDEEEVREEKPTKLSSGNLKVQSATNSTRSSPDTDRKEPSPEATGDAQPAVEATTPKAPRPKAASKDVAAEYAKERGAHKALLNLVVIGHVDAGKSTLMGHLLYRLGCVQKKQMHKYEQESKKLGKASFMYAWVLDETSEERNRGITMDVAQAKFETPNRSIVLLDAPGHRDFIPNMITGAAQADVAILVVDATRGEFETGFEMGGQTREHTLLVRSLGVSQLAVAINKLDNVSWDEARYNEITAKLRSFLRQAGYRESDFTFVPCSGLTGANLIDRPAADSPLTKWYSGPCLVDVIDNFKPPERPVSKPFRLCVSDVFKGMGSGFCVSGRVDAGCVSNGDKVLVMPAAEQGTVKGITIDEVPVPQAFAGDQVALTLSGVDMIKVTTGSFVCDPAVPIRVSTRFQARLVVFNIEVPLTRGFPVVLHYQSTSEQASIHRILSQLNKGTGEVVRNRPRCLVKNTSGLVEIKVCRPMCVELYKEFKELGRITLRSGGSTVAAGVITEVL